MIINTSRIHQFKECRQKTWNWNELHLKAHREETPLLVGSGFHKGLAVINTKSGTLETAVDASEAEYKLRANWDKMLDAEKKVYQKDIDLIRSMVQVYGEYYINEQYQMLAPEVAFCVPLPNSEHHCWYVHKLLHPDERFGIHYKESSGEIGMWDCDDPKCWQPHYLTGTSDAVIVWNHVVYLMEHKTTAYDLYNDSPQSKNYVRQWQLNDQATAYIYGIWKSLKVKPHGVLLNVVIKPRKNAANPVFNFYREAFLRSDEDLQRFETETIRVANNYETAMRTHDIYMNPSACFNYNRECYYRPMCLNHREALPGEFQERPADYVELSYYKLLDLELPKGTNNERSDLGTETSLEA